MVFSFAKVEVVECKDLKSCDTFGKNDVYVELHLGNESNKKTTTIKDNAGETAVFNEIFELYVMVL